MSHGLGRLPAADERDMSYPMRSALPETITFPRFTYWIPTGVLDQNGYPHCVGYAWSGWMRSSPLRTLNGPAPDWIYHEAQKIDEWPGEDYDGTSVRAGAKILMDQGRIKEYRWAQTVDDIKAWVLTKGPVVLGTTWYNGMFEIDSKGYVSLTGSSAGGHAYLCIGYSSGSRASSGRPAFRCINSWGKDWGQRGRFWIAEDDMAALMADYGEACAAVEKRP